MGGGLADEDTVLRLQEALVAAVRSGELPEERLADAAARVRSLAAWTTGTRRAPSAADAPAPEIGLTAARRAVTVTRAAGPAPVTDPVYVATFSPAPNIAVGDETPWGVGAELERLLPGTTTGHFTGPLLKHGGAARGERPPCRRGGPRRTPAPVDGRGPGHADRGGAGHGGRGDGGAAVGAAGALHIATHGAARVCGVAAAEAVLAG